MEKIHEQSLNILAKTGIKVSHRRALELLSAAGAKVKFDAEHVYFPKRLIDRCIEMTPKTVTLFAQDPKYDVVLPHPEGSFYTRCNTGARECIDIRNGQCRNVTTSDIEEWVKVVDYLENIDLCSVPSPADAPNATKDIHALRVAFKNTKKHVISQPHSEESIDFLAEMAIAASGGSTADFKKRPILGLLSVCFSPLAYKAMDIEVMFVAGQYNMSIQLASLATPGGTSPITVAGSILLSNVEMLAGTAIAQVINPRVPVILAPQKFPLSMKTGAPLQGTIEGALANAAGVQLIKDLYQIPTRMYSPTSDAFFPDLQSMIERTYLSVLNVLGKADIISGAGQLEAAATISLLQLVIDNDIIGILRKMLEGVKMDEESLASEIINRVGPGGNFLDQEHTARHCREFYTPATFYRGTRQAWKASGAKTITDRATEKVFAILEKHKTSYLGGRISQELDKIVEKADKKLVHK
jgi:trimethylamine:corrinoid methyltransferase-like protein